jgi:hypothetical protein
MEPTYTEEEIRYLYAEKQKEPFPKKKQIKFALQTYLIILAVSAGMTWIALWIIDKIA